MTVCREIDYIYRNVQISVSMSIILLRFMRFLGSCVLV